MNTIETKKFMVDMLCNADVCAEENYIVLSPQTPMTAEIRNRLIEWGFETLQTTGELTTVSKQAMDLSGMETHADDRKHMEITSLFYQNTLVNLDTLFKRYMQDGQMPPNNMNIQVHALLEHMKENRKYILRFSELTKIHTGYSYILTNSLMTAILSLAMGMYLKMPIHRLLDLVSAALLHKIGLLKLPPELYQSEKKLTPEQRTILIAHPLVAYKVLKKEAYNPYICAAVLECNELINGTGYPRKLKGGQLSGYGKIIAVAQNYVGLVSQRPDRKPINPHQSMLMMLTNRGTAYDETVIKTLINVLSLYPIGSLIELSNGYQGMVVDVNDDNPKQPVVHMIVTPDGIRLGANQVVNMETAGLTVKRILTSEDA